jgi:hypothetical protein
MRRHWIPAQPICGLSIKSQRSSSARVSRYSRLSKPVLAARSLGACPRRRQRGSRYHSKMTGRRYRGEVRRRPAKFLMKQARPTRPSATRRAASIPAAIPRSQPQIRDQPVRPSRSSPGALAGWGIARRPGWRRGPICPRDRGPFTCRDKMAGRAAVGSPSSQVHEWSPRARVGTMTRGVLY